MHALRIVIILILLLPVTCLAMAVQWLCVKTGLRARRHIPLYWHRYVLWLFGIKVSVKGAPSSHRPLFITPNHSSWLDIVVIGSRMPLSFIAKAEVARWPLFGSLARLQRTVFVNRERRQKTGEVNNEIATRLKSGDAMVLFAEGTSSDGNRVLPFRSALIGAANMALSDNEEESVWLQPMSVAYTHLQGIPMGRHQRHISCWFGDMDLVPHLIGVIKEGAIDVEVTWGEPIAITKSSNRKLIAKDAEVITRNALASSLTGTR